MERKGEHRLNEWEDSEDIIRDLTASWMLSRSEIDAENEKELEMEQWSSECPCFTPVINIYWRII